ncbi:MAG: hypothetical protein V3S28_07840 [Acidimicrobiia bacterium]
MIGAVMKEMVVRVMAAEVRRYVTPAHSARAVSAPRATAQGVVKGVKKVSKPWDARDVRLSQCS